MTKSSTSLWRVSLTVSPQCVFSQAATDKNLQPGLQWSTHARVHHRAVRKDTHAGLQQILRHATNYGCGSAIGCNEWRLLIRHRAARKDTHAGLQRVLRRAMTHGCGSAIGCNEWHNPTSDATAVAQKKKRNSNTSAKLLPAASHVCLSTYLSINLSKCLSIYQFFYPSIYRANYLSICLAICLSIDQMLSLSLSL